MEANINVVEATWENERSSDHLQNFVMSRLVALESVDL